MDDARIFPKLTNNMCKSPMNIGKTKLLYPIIPEPKLTQEASIATANPRKIASFVSIQFELFISKLVEMLFFDFFKLQIPNNINIEAPSTEEIIGENKREI